MLYHINDKSNQLELITSTWNPAELQLEKYLITSADSEAKMMADSIFGEPLLLLSNQVRTATKKRADILALDRYGNSVIIELKRDKGKLGVETQALQYLADFSSYRGRHFLKKFSSAEVTEDSILGFMGDKATIDDLNLRSRVILIARSFDESVFAIGEWLSSKGVAFRCISYTPIEISGKKMLSFSIAFDHSPEGLFQLSFSSNAREPEIFWHNIANTNPEWWKFLRTKGQIPACFQNSPGDQGEKILTKYIEGDTIIAYAKGYGAIGWGLIENPKYRIIPVGDPSDDKLNGNCRHRINITWKAVAKSLSEGLAPEVVRNQFGIYHPISTSVSINRQNGLLLINELSHRFPGET